MTPPELQALFTFIDEVAEAGIADSTAAGTVDFQHNGRNFLIEVKAYDLTGIDLD